MKLSKVLNSRESLRFSSFFVAISSRVKDSDSSVAWWDCAIEFRGVCDGCAVSGMLARSGTRG